MQCENKACNCGKRLASQKGWDALYRASRSLPGLLLYITVYMTFYQKNLKYKKLPWNARHDGKVMPILNI